MLSPKVSRKSLIVLLLGIIDDPRRSFVKTRPILRRNWQARDNNSKYSGKVISSIDPLMIRASAHNNIVRL